MKLFICLTLATAIISGCGESDNDIVAVQSPTPEPTKALTPAPAATVAVSRTKPGWQPAPAPEIKTADAAPKEDVMPEALRGRFDQWFTPKDAADKIEGFGAQERFSGVEKDNNLSCRWSAPKSWFTLKDNGRASTITLNFMFAPMTGKDYQPDLKFFVNRGKTPQNQPIKGPDYRPGSLDIELPVPEGNEPVMIGWTVKGVNPAKLEMGPDDRDLGIRVNWIGVKHNDMPEALAGRFDQWHAPRDIAGKIEGFENSERFFSEEKDAVGPFRWSKPKSWITIKDGGKASTITLCFTYTPMIGTDYQPDLKVFLDRGNTPKNTPVKGPEFRQGPIEMDLPAPEGSEPLMLGWMVKGVNFAKLNKSADDRDLGLRINWIAQETGQRVRHQADNHGQARTKNEAAADASEKKDVSKDKDKPDDATAPPIPSGAIGALPEPGTAAKEPVTESSDTQKKDEETETAAPKDKEKDAKTGAKKETPAAKGKQTARETPGRDASSAKPRHSTKATSQPIGF
ncbi:MAG: hypothetical protein NTY46_08165 [Candidatus Sumerlaeota bacterium]|nr:hypothetical protein [Candidatus Sumerlaeota bacterium]